RVGPILTLPTSLPAPPDTIGNVSISPLGDYMDVKYADKIYRDGSTDSLVTADAHRILGVDPGTLALSAHPMSPGTVCDPGGAYASLFPPSQGWIFPLKHADMGLTETGEEVIVGGRACVGGPDIGRVTMVKLGDGTVLGLTNPENEASVGWVSMRNLDRPGWAYVTYMNNPSQIGKRYWDEVISVKTDGSRALQRWGHSRCVCSSSQPSYSDVAPLSGTLRPNAETSSRRIKHGLRPPPQRTSSEQSRTGPTMLRSCRPTWRP